MARYEGLFHTQPTWTGWVELNETTGQVTGHVDAPDNIAYSGFGYGFMRVYGSVRDANDQELSTKILGEAPLSGRYFMGSPDRYSPFDLSEHMDGVPGGVTFKIFINCDAANYQGCNQSHAFDAENSTSWSNAGSAPGHLLVTLQLSNTPVTPPEPDPEPIQCYLRNTNPYNNDQHISASPTSISVQAYVSTSTPSRNRPNYYWIWESGEDPDVNGDIYRGTWKWADIDYTGLTPGSSHQMHAVAVNDAGNGGRADLTIRTRKPAPIISVSITSTTLETVTFRWSSDRYLARCYAVVGDDTIELGSNVASGTATSKWHNPNTSVTITVHGYVEAGDQETHGQASVTGKTLDIARYSSASGVFGNALRVNYSRPSAYGIMVTLFAKNSAGTTSVTVTSGSANSQIRTKYTDITFTQDQLDSIYRTYLNNINTTTLYITISTFGDSSRPGGPIKYNDTQRAYTLTLTGIAKTMWFGVNDDQIPHRCQAWWGDDSGNARRGVGFWGDNSGTGRRTI